MTLRDGKSEKIIKQNMIKLIADGFTADEATLIAHSKAGKRVTKKVCRTQLPGRTCRNQAAQYQE